MEPGTTVLSGHSVVVSGRRILAVAPTAECETAYDTATRVELPDHVLIPGLVNLHTHAAMSLLRGIADDLALMDWLRRRIWPAETRHVSAQFVRDGTLLACAEMLRGGVTCFNDMYFFPGAAAEAALRLGMRAVLGIVVIEFPTPFASDADDYIAKGLAARDEHRGEPLISFSMAPHSPYTVSDRSFARVLTLAQQLDIPIHVHLHETLDEIRQSMALHGVRPLERLRRLGLAGPHLLAVHGVHLEANEIDLLARSGCSLVHCPTSNMKLASGAAPVASALAAGIKLGLGTDGAASNNRLDILQEVRHAALLGKLTSGDATALDAHAVLRMATLDGATALGLGDEIGSIRPGKQADMCAICLSTPETRPCYDPVSHLVHVAGREHVSHVWIAGHLCVQDHRLLQIHNTELLDIASLWQNRLHQ